MCHDNEWLIDGPWLIPSFEQTVEVLHLVSVAEEYELVEVAHHPVRTRRPSIGFDIGYWASGNFPIICDSLVWPLWHPPPPEALQSLSHYAKKLNEHVLFRRMKRVIFVTSIAHRSGPSRAGNLRSLKSHWYTTADELSKYVALQ